MNGSVSVAGVGMLPFTTTESSGGEIAERAIRSALSDACLDAELVDQAVASQLYGDSRSGERALKRAGIAGIAVSNVSNGAASGSAALFHARQALLSGEAECTIAIGFEEVLQAVDCAWTGCVDPLERHGACLAAAGTRAEAGTVQHEFLRLCQAQLDWMIDEMGISDEAFVRVVVKARAHAQENPLAIHRTPLSIAQVLAAPVIAGRLRNVYASQPVCGAAAVILCTPRFAVRHGLRGNVLLTAHALESHDAGKVEEVNLLDALGRETTRRVAERAYEQAGIDPPDVDVAEIHDCCVSNELISCAALGLCAEDGIEAFVRSGANTYGGKVVVSPSGGLLSNGTAHGATGLAQICELTWQLRGDAGARQVRGTRTALQHNGGFGSAVSVAILQRKQ